MYNKCLGTAAGSVGSQHQLYRGEPVAAPGGARQQRQQRKLGK